MRVHDTRPAIVREADDPELLRLRDSIKKRLGEVEGLNMKIIDRAGAIGKDLITVRKRSPKKFGRWVKENLGITTQHARNYIAMWEYRDRIEDCVSMSQALRVIQEIKSTESGKRPLPAGHSSKNLELRKKNLRKSLDKLTRKINPPDGVKLPQDVVLEIFQEFWDKVYGN